jgi:transcriptional regulator with XRE-family HTH domain
MTVHRWERSQRSISEENLDRLCEIYDKPLRWFLTLEERDLEQENASSETQGFGVASSAAAQRLSRKIAQAPAIDRPMIEKVVEDLLDALKSR